MEINFKQKVKMENEIKVQEVNGVELADKATCDIQIATAKQFPRNVMNCTNNMIAIATMDLETAKSCSYALPRGGKTITGGSVHLAKIIAQNWGNLRVESRVSKITATNIYSESVAWDLETNTAIKIESTRKIVGKNGQRFNEDLISLTGQVTSSIALRNAIFAVVPKSIVEKVHKASQRAITGDLSTEEKMLKKRKSVLDKFKDAYNVSEKEILTAMGLNSTSQIKQEQITVLLGMHQSLVDGEFTVDEMFSRIPEDDKNNMLKNPEARK
jgi:hypothetical protein